MIKINELTKLESGKYCCDFCKKTFSEKGISTHIWRKHTNDGLGAHNICLLINYDYLYKK